MGRLIGIIFILLAVIDEETKGRIRKFIWDIFGNKSANDKNSPSFPDLQKTVGGKMSGAPDQKASKSKANAGSGSIPSYTYSTSGNSSNSGSTVRSQSNKASGKQEQYVRPVMKHRGGRLKSIAAYGLFGVSAISFWYLLVSVFENIASSTPLLEYANLVPNLIVSIVCLLVGIWLLYTKKHKYDRENRYIAIINQGYGMIPIDNICNQFPVKYDTCVQELQEMINNGILPGAYIDYGRRLLVLDPNSSSIEPVIRDSKGASSGSDASSGADKSKSKSNKISEQKIDFLSLERLSKQVKDEDIKMKLIRISTTLKMIGQKAEEDPDIKKAAGVDTFMDMYLPKTIKLVEDYEEVNAVSDLQQNNELKQSILETLDAIDDATMTLWKDIIHSDVIDISAELDALQTKLILDGYKKSDLEPEVAPAEFTFDGMDISGEQPTVSAEHARVSSTEDKVRDTVISAEIKAEQAEADREARQAEAEKAARMADDEAARAAKEAEDKDAAMEADLFAKLRAEQEKEKEVVR